MNQKLKKIQKETIHSILDKGYLISPDLLETEELGNGFLELLKKNILSKEKPVVVSKDVFQGITKNKIKTFDWLEFDKSKVLLEKGTNSKSYNIFKSLLCGEDLPEVTKEKPKETIPLQQEEKISVESEGTVKIIKNYEKNSKKWAVKDFTLYFKKRYNFLQKILQGRPELQNAISINRIRNKESKSKVCCVGLVYSIRETKKGSTMITLEDPTGFVNIIFKPDVEGIRDLALDEVIGVSGVMGRGMLYGESIIYPGIPINANLKSSKDDVYAAIISDIHLGSDNFLEKEFLEFIDWLNLEKGDEKEKNIATKVKYLFIVGDLVAGVGVFPNQEQHLVINDLRKQYAKVAEYLSRIRKDIKLIICPGNHDATRLADPQPPTLPDFAGPLLQLKNASFVSSPAVVNIHSSEDFEGFDFLMYHGNSFHFYANGVSHLRLADAKNHPTMTWKYLLNKRHLAPTHGSTVYLPNSEEDALLLDKIPDVVINGDMHTSDMEVYNGLMIISSSCWESKSEMQERRGNEPDPGRVPFFNLKTRKVLFLDFYKEK